jgi:hypothetical protein
MSIVLLTLLGCAEEDVVEYEQLNSSEDALEIQVGLQEESAALTLDLNSNTGAFVVGTATIEPGGGPVGTLHTLTVLITDEDLANKVDLVSVITSAQGRSDEEFDLVADSADETFFRTELVSVGGDEEQRTDLLYVRVLDVVGDNDGTSTTDTGQ